MVHSRNAILKAQIGLFLLGISGSLYAALTPANSMVNWYSTDDAYFYFKVAQNILAGHGSTFDQINLTNGFHPLWMLICLAVFGLGKIHLLLPLRVMILISGLLNGLTGVLLFRLTRKILHPFAAVVGAVIWMLLPSIYNSYVVQGLESALSACLIVLLLIVGGSLYQPGGEQKPIKLLLLGLVGALTVLARLDNLFIVAMVGVFVVFRIHRIHRLLIYDLVGILISAIFAWIIRFGTAPVVLNNYSVYPLMVIAFLVLPVIFFFSGFYSAGFKNNLYEFVGRLAVAGIAGTLTIYAAMRLLWMAGIHLMISRALILLVVGFSILFVALIRKFYRPSRTEKQLSPWQTFSKWIRENSLLYLKNGIYFSIPILLLNGGYVLYNKLQFGTWTPVSGQIKVWWGTLENTVYQQNNSLVDLFGLTPGRGSSPWSLLTTQVGEATIFLRNLFSQDSRLLPTRLFILFMFLIFLLMVWLLSRRNGYLARKSFSLLIPPLITGCFLQIAYYGANNYGATRTWYWVAQSLVLVLLGMVILSRIFEIIREKTGHNTINLIVTFALIGLTAFLHTRLLLHQFPYSVPTEKEAEYLVQIRELEKETEENSIIGMTGGGMTAYFINGRTIVNLDGLINSPQYFAAMKNGTAAEFLAEMGLDYVFGNPYMLLESDPYRSIFSGNLTSLGQLPGSAHFTLYRFNPRR